MAILLTKLAEENDPCICIVYTNLFEAQQTNKDLVARFYQEKYAVNFIPIPDTNQLNLVLVTGSVKRTYKQLLYDPGKFYWWLKYTRFDKKFRFMHLYLDQGRYRMVRTERDQRKFELSVVSYTLINEVAMRVV